MRWIALLLSLVASGCHSLDVKAVTFNVSVNLTLPADKGK